MIESSIVTLSFPEPLTAADQDNLKNSYCDRINMLTNIVATCTIEESSLRRRRLLAMNYVLSAMAAPEVQESMVPLPQTFADDVVDIALDLGLPEPTVVEVDIGGAYLYKAQPRRPTGRYIQHLKLKDKRHEVDAICVVCLAISSDSTDTGSAAGVILAIGQIF